jgi:hypothetical protein
MSDDAKPSPGRRDACGADFDTEPKHVATQLAQRVFDVPHEAPRALSECIMYVAVILSTGAFLAHSVTETAATLPAVSINDVAIRPKLCANERQALTATYRGGQTLHPFIAQAARRRQETDSAPRSIRGERRALTVLTLYVRVRSRAEGTAFSCRLRGFGDTGDRSSSF